MRHRTAKTGRRPWYVECMWRHGVSHDMIMGLGAGKKINADSVSSLQALARLRERGIISPDRAELTKNGRLLYVAESLDISSTSLLVLCAMYARIHHAKFYVKSYEYFAPTGLSHRIIRNAFDGLASKQIIFRRPGMRLFWHIRSDVMRRLKPHKKLILAADAEIHG